MAPARLRQLDDEESSVIATFLYKLGGFAARKKWVALGLWALAIVGAVFVMKVVGANTSNDLRLPGTDSQRATDVLAKKFPPQQNGSSPVVFHVESGKISAKKPKQAIQAAHSRIAKLPHVYSAPSPFAQNHEAQISKGGKTAYIPVLLDVGGSDLTEDLAQKVLSAAEPAERDGVQVAVGGPIGSELSEPKTESSEVIGLLAAMIILAFTFGTFVAMGLPIVSAVLGLGVGLAAIALLGHVVNVPTIAPTLATMIGLGVGIDYALFLVTRYRANRREGIELHEAIARAVATSGTAIVFAGGTVVIALVTLLIAGIPLVTSLGYAAAFAVITAVLAAITLLPAVLSLVGPHIDSARMPSFLRPKPKDADRGFWGGWARFVTNHPWVSSFASLAILVPLILPLHALDLGQEDIAATPKKTQERQSYDLMAKAFGPGYNGPLLVAVDLGTPAKASSTFLKQKQQAESLNVTLQQEQKQGTAEQKNLQGQATSLEDQQTSLEQQQQELESESATLQKQADELNAQKSQILATGNDLKKQQTALLKQADTLGDQADQLVKKGASLGKQAASLTAQLADVRAKERAIEARLEKPATDKERQKDTADLQKLQKQEDSLESQLNKVLDQEQDVREDAQKLLNQAAGLRKQEKDITSSAEDLAKQSQSLAKQGEEVIKQKQQLSDEASDLQVSAAQLQTSQAQLETQKVQLQGKQQTAKQQQQQAEQLQQTLTNELTKAGGDERGTDPRIVKLQDALSGTKGISAVSPPKINKSGDAAVFSAVPTTDPADPATADLVEQLRDFTIPQATQGTNLEAYVGGTTATYVDLAAGISSRLLLVILVVVFLSFLVLLMAYRAVIVAGQAALTNVISVSAAFGVLTACFQWGWGLPIIGLDAPGGTDPIASFVPLMMFAVLFGLSMDYQVFLLSQVEHHKAQGKKTRQAVAAGLASSARVIAAAALIMISVFGSFILNGDPTVKQFGVGLAVGVALAATSVLLLAPALLVMSGRGAWWVPRWLDRILPHLDIEGAGAERKRERVPEIPSPADAA